jgi:excisionase family DNA binding protein
MNMGSWREGMAATPSRSADSPLLDIDDVAVVLSVTRRHVQRLVAERRIPFIKVGRFVRFDEGSITVWIDQNRVEPVRGGIGQSITRR